MKPLLQKKDGAVDKRLRLFDMSVTQAALWCSESWLLTQAETRRLRATQNQMLRRIVCPRRRPEEDHIQWIKRSTKASIGAAKNAGIRFWLEEHYRSKWQWAGHIIRMSPERLARRATVWRDSAWCAEERRNLPHSLRERRRGRRRWLRWEDDLRRYAATCGWESWQRAATNRDERREHSAKFVVLMRRK